MSTETVIVSGKTGAGDKGFNAPLFSAVARYFRAVAQLIVVHPRQRVMPPLARGAITADVYTTVDRHA